ncbi:MAG TPA: N-acetylglutaminylglutamine amidotransferase, partial [Planctomycetota bacterium]|nr:N-acetylglutaminylglutamine amidotransferase [Planctomycetota bacterium]
MCGIAGELRFDGRPASLAALEAMCAVLEPRGPDGSGVFARGALGLAHRRLAVFDLTEHSAQPMVEPELGLSLVYNGAIYNYRELRGELEALGYRFHSDGDTEVLLKAFHAWGADCVERLQGMFAFAVWDRERRELTLGRDALGIKPLYLAEVDGALRFASTLPALLAAGGVDTSIDGIALQHYMSFHSVVPAPRTILRGVRKLPPATVLTVGEDGARRERTWWRLEYPAEPLDVDLEQATDLVEACLRTAVERRQVAAVPVGVLLSGGLDSSLVVALLAEGGQQGLQTFSIGFESIDDMDGDEFRWSDLVAERFGTDHRRIRIDAARTRESVPLAIDAMSEPMVSHDVVGFWLLSQEVARHRRVVQSGQGADEVFAGYHWYPPLMESGDPVSDYARVFFDRDAAALGRVLNPEFLDGDAAREFVTAHFALPGAERAIDKALRLDTTVMLVEDPVKRVDNMTMSFGLEARVPFLDRDLVELAARLPAELKVPEGGKRVLRQVGYRLLPHAVIDRPKGYFPVPA